MVRFFALAAAALLFTAFTAYTVQSYTIGENYVVAFDGRGASGTFSGLAGTIVFDPAQLEQSKLDVYVDAATISTGNKTKDKHARGEDWFAVDRYPDIGFVSSAFAKTGTSYVVTGQLTLHGETHEVEIPFRFTPNLPGGIFEGSFTIDRQDYGITGPWMGFAVSDELEVSLKVPVTSPSY